MSKKIVDACGRLCPKPIIMTKAALNAAAVGDEIDIVINKEASKNNTVQFLEGNGISVTVEESEGVFTLHVKKVDRVIDAVVLETACPVTGAKQ